MKISIKIKLLLISILLILLTTASISVAYYILAKQDKQRESWQRIQIAFDIMLDDFTDRVNTYTKRFNEFLQGDSTLHGATYFYSQDPSTVSSPTFPATLNRVVAELKKFGLIISADHLMLYGADKRLLAVYQHYGDREIMGGYVVSETGNDTYLPMDNLFQLTTILVGDEPIPDTPLPSGIAASYKGDIPDTTSTHLFTDGRKLGLRILAPISRDQSKTGLLVGEILTTQSIVEQYASLSKTDVNFFAGNQLSIGTLPAQTAIEPEVLEHMVSCEEMTVINISSFTIDKQDYYQGRCAIKSIHGTIGAVTVSLSKDIEKQAIRKILTTVLTISTLVIGVGFFAISVLGRVLFANPLEKLMTAMKEVEAGNFDVEAHITANDELGQLAGAFNRMGFQLKKSFQTREQLVAELREKNEVLKIEITERKRAEEKLKQYRDHLEDLVKERTEELNHAKETAEKAQRTAEAANRAKSVFLANMSHELRTPLNAILGFSQLMGSSQTLPLEHREKLDIISRSGEHLLTLINDILALSKIEAGRVSLHENNFDLYRLLNDLEDMFRLRTEEKHLQLIFEHSPDVPRYVRTDEVRLRQVLINLLNNAIKFTEEGEVSVRVKRIENCRLKTENWRREEGNRQSSIVNIQFSIGDTGPGIAPDELETLFEPFIQTKTSRRIQEGTGLGLAISRSFVQLMGGDITVRSEVGRGTTFSFDIQVDIIEATEIESKQVTRRVIALEPDQPQYRLLVVDDKPDNRKLLVKLLSNLGPPPSGFEIREASNGQEALEIWETWKPHLIWMDMRMPVMDGYEATKRIKSEIQNSKSEIQTVIIAVTASSFEEERAVILSAGCDDFLRKPFRQRDVFEMMHKHLGVRFVYEEDEKAKGEGQRAKGEDVLTPMTLAALPNELRTGLQQAIEVLNVDMAHGLIDQIRQQNEPLADTLAELVKNYRFDILQKLFENIK